jgi:hypothetical protein
MEMGQNLQYILYGDGSKSVIIVIFEEIYKKKDILLGFNPSARVLSHSHMFPLEWGWRNIRDIPWEETACLNINKAKRL